MEFSEMWDFEDPAGTRTRFQELLARTDHPAERAEIGTQIARTHGLELDFESADAVLDRVDASLTADMAAARIRSLLERGRVRNSSGDRAAARAPFEAALAAAQDAGMDDLAVDAAHMLAIATSGDEAAWNERALAISAASADPAARRWQGSLYNNLGWTYHDRRDHERALVMFERCLAYFEAAGSVDRANIARWSIGKTYRFLGRIDEALEVHRGLLMQPGYDGTPSEGYAREEIAECLLKRGEPDDARPEFARAWQLLHDDPWLQRDEAPRLRRMHDLGARPAQ
jgi:tetratricopeptide (TPR) repeat protein